MFSAGRRRQQTIDPRFGRHVRICTVSLGKVGELFRRRRKPGQGQAQPAGKHCRLSVVLWLESSFIELGQDESVDRGARPLGP